MGDKSLVSLRINDVDPTPVPHSRCGGSSWNLRDHTAGSLCEALADDPFAEMPDDFIVSAIVCDGGSNFQLAGRRSVGKDETLYCICHGQNNGARAVAMETGFAPIFDKLDRLVNYVYGSSGCEKRFEAVVVSSPPGTRPQKLIRTGETRWITCVSSFESDARLRDADNNFIGPSQARPSRCCCPTRSSRSCLSSARFYNRLPE